MRVLRIVPLLALIPWGCVQADQAFTIFPDGSGKLTLNVGIKKQMIQMIEDMAKQFGGKTPDGRPLKNPFDAFRDPQQLAKDSEGIVAWVPAGYSEAGEWYRATVVGYFEDINKVRLYSTKMGPEGSTRKLSFSARFAKTPSGGTLSLDRFVRDELSEFNQRMGREQNPEAAKATLELMKPVLQDLRVRLSLTVPGAISSAEGFLDVQDRTVSIAFDGDLMIAVATNPEGETARKLQKISQSQASSVTWTAGDVDPVALAAFKDEMAAAKAKWSGIRGVAPSTPSAPSKPESLGADAEQFTDDEVDRLFIEAQLKIARQQIERGQKDKARATLEGVLKDFPKAKAAQEAKKILESLK